jgi:hypothetical protein
MVKYGEISLAWAEIIFRDVQLISIFGTSNEGIQS